MPTLLVIRLHPIEPVTGDDFTGYLDGLSIAAHEVSYSDPTGSGPAFGTAAYIAPTNPGVLPPVHDPNTRIAQHFGPDFDTPLLLAFYAVATAVIEIPDPPAGEEYQTADVRLEITRNGGEIVHKQIYYNVPVTPIPLPADPIDYQILLPLTSLHLALPPGQVGSPTITVPEDGTAPNFATLRTAVENVLNAEPGNLAGIADLTAAQCRHIAYELIWNRQAYPLPVPKRLLEQIYTGPQDADSDDERDRKIFEGDLLTYYTTHNTEAERLTNFIFSLSAAIWCEQRSQQATTAGFDFPVFPATPDQIAKVILTAPGGGVLNPAFTVPAEYFYALTAILPPQVKREQRYSMVTLDAEAQTVANLEQALEDQVLTEPAGVNRFQAARRLRALGAVGEVGTPDCVVAPATPLHGLITDWLAFAGADINLFWTTLSAANTSAHLDLVLCAITQDDTDLITAIKDPPFSVTTINGLVAKTNTNWEALFEADPTLLPDFTKPGTTAERIQAFIRHLRKFFDLISVVDPPGAPTAEDVPQLSRSPGNPVDLLLAAYPGFTFTGWDPVQLDAALNTIFPGDPTAQQQFTGWLLCIQQLINLTNGITPVEIQFSVMEAIWARGVTNPSRIHGLTFADFQAALTGSVAYHYAQTIWDNVEATQPNPPSRSKLFAPVNPGTLVNCVPPAHLSPLGPVAYLHDLLHVTADSTCAEPLPSESEQQTLLLLLASRRGLLAALQVTNANLSVPLPLIDIVNESLELMVANSVAHGAVYNTATNQVGGHELTSHPAPTPGAYLHDPETLLEALPEHSTPATPTEKQGAYNKLKDDFSACSLPYSQRLDVSRTYLAQLGTSRFVTMRRFRRAITEFVLDPAHPSAEFQSHLYRYPVQIDTAIEYLGITPEEYTELFQDFLSNAATPGKVRLYYLYGFPAKTAANGVDWTASVTLLSEFLARTCLTYCEFLELWKSEFVKFSRKNHLKQGFPDCEPCCLEQYQIDFIDLGNVDALRRLIIFIRLWRKLQAISNARYTFTELRDICEALGFWSGTNINPDFIRQLAAFQMLRDDFKLALTDGTAPAAGATGADRLHLLAFWVPKAAKWSWALEHLLNQIQHYAVHAYKCHYRGPEFIKLLRTNLDPLSALAGFDPNTPADTWYAHPTHTLRLAEILAKIYASNFEVGELLFLFTAADHLQGDDPFPLQTANEAKDSPLGLPDDEDQYSLWVLRKKLLAVEISTEAAQQWTWAQMTTVLRTEFGFTAPPANNRWLSLGQHFFPSILTASGLPVSLTQRQYRVALPPPTSELMWNTPPAGPFQYDAINQELWTQLPLSDEDVIAKLSRIRQLTIAEQSAVRALYFLPRVDLIHFAFLFTNPGEAEERLLQDPDETARWAWFQQEFARFYQRCHIIAEHLADHCAAATDAANPAEPQLVQLILKNLWADENLALAPWENDNGQAPAVTWQPLPNGGAFAALLGLTGTGLVAEYYSAAQVLRWRELRGGIDAFGSEENTANAPIPTVLPGMSFTLTPEQLRFIAVRNGFALANRDGAAIGGAEPFILRWQGLLLIEEEGQYGFSAGAPTLGDALPDFEQADQWHSWRVTLQRGQKTWILLAHDWPNEEAPHACSQPITLKKGFYELRIELNRKPLFFDGPEDLCPQTTGFQLKYNGPDANLTWAAIPYDKLFQPQKDNTLLAELDLAGAAQAFLAAHYTSSVRDLRRTYQRAFKALLFCRRLSLSAQPVADDGQSELGYLLAHPVNFVGQAYYRNGGLFQTHKANFDFNFLPVLDNYSAPSPVQDQRVAPTPQRQQALFDWWERLFDYTVMRRETQRSPEQPAWLLFHEAAETHEDNPAQLLRHIGVDLRHDTLVLQFFDPAQADLSYDVTSANLMDDRWAVRVWQAEKWVRALLKRFYPQDITKAQPFLWASDGPELAGNSNLTQFYRNGCIENSDPRRYVEIKRLNDGLRERGRTALIAYLTHRERVALPWGGFATTAKDLSELLLLDVEVGLCQKASRVEEAISAIHLFVQRARLGLESGLVVPPAFVLAWERHFATFRIWEACKRRLIYRENWIEWDELERAQRTEAFQFLEAELRRATLTVPVPGGLTYWNGARPPVHPGLTLLQHRQPATTQLLNPALEGLGLMGTPDHHARPSWLAPLRLSNRDQTPGEPTNPPPQPPPGDQPSDPSMLFAVAPPRQANAADLPLWLQAAVRLGTKFIRVAAATLPPATTTFAPKCDPIDTSVCCTTCGKNHPALLDEYYFWIEESRAYDKVTQIAEWGATADNPQLNVTGDPQTDWHRSDKLPTLLHWQSERIVHLRWCRVHNGEFQQPRQSYEGVRLAAGAIPQLVFAGRQGDSLHFEVTGGEKPEGYPDPLPPPGFRYDLAPDEAVVLPEVVTATPPALVGGLAAFPFFALFDPGAPLLPPSLFSPAIAVAGHLRAHCHFEEALKWYELVYNPLHQDNLWLACLRPPVDPSHPTPPGDVVLASTINPLRDPCCCASNPISPVEAQERAILLYYLDTLLQWGDAILRQNTPEAFQQARLLFDTAAKILGPMPITVLAEDTAMMPPSVANFVAACAPLNPRLLCLYTSIADRLALIHACLNAKRLHNGRPNLDMPYFGNSPVRDCWKLPNDPCGDENEWCLPQSPYRFMVLVQKAQEIANDVRTLGAALLAAFEKGDAEYLATMRVMHERQLLNLALVVRQNQWREADWQVQALQKTKQIAQTNLQYYNNLIANGLISGESQYEPLTITSTTIRSAGNISEAIGQAMNLIPDPNVGFPVSFLTLQPGKKLAMIFAAAGKIANTAADIISTVASLGLTKAGWDRREQEWEHQVDVLTIEIEQIERQILAAERRRDVALRELNNHQQQIDNAAEVHDFLRDKFTNHTLYLWLQQETAALYYQMYEMALHCARQAQRAFNFERGHTARQFIPNEIWDNLHEGLLAGERLQLAIRHMDKAYYDENVREYELTKHISLRLHFPLAFLQLQITGYCEIDIPEWLFDLDYPGHYMRRIKNVTMTLPAVVGPYTTIHCRLTQLSSKTRVDPRLVQPPHTCCTNEQWKNGYPALPDDPRIVALYAATEAIATSSGQNDSGLFELNFRDERYLPFEFIGAVSRWRIELPPENNQFDLGTVTDLILHINFMAREGSDNLRQAANEYAQQNLPGAGLRFFDIQQEFPDAWHILTSPTAAQPTNRQLGLRLSRNLFPFLPGNKPIGVNRLELLFAAPDADPSAHHVVEFLVGQRAGRVKGEKCDCAIYSVICIANACWPGLFHGAIDVDLPTLSLTGYQDTGVFRFPSAVGEITDVYLFCGYKVM